MRGTRCCRGRCVVIAGIVGVVVILLYLTLQLDDEGHVTFNFLTHSQMKEFFKVEKEDTCQRRDDNVLTTMFGGKLSVHSNVAKTYYPSLHHCYYRSMTYNSKEFNNATYGPKVDVVVGVETPVQDDVIMVECEDREKHIVFRQLHKQIVAKQRNIHGEPFVKRQPQDLNVLGVILESTGKLAWLHHAPELHKYITEELGGVLLEKHTKTGLNTNPNVYSLITGRKIYQDWKTLLMNKVSDIPTIINDFVRDGYVTLLSEEVGKVPKFIRYFTSPPVDHWDRPTLVTVSNFGVPAVDYLTRTKKEEDFCYGTQHKVRMTLDWITDFTRKYKDFRWAALTYMNRPLGTHKDLNGIGRNVGIIESFLKNLQTSGVLDNTIVFLGGDHGNGFVEDYFKTQIGSYEARLPLGYIITPKWFQNKYKTAYNNLKFNGRERLTSHFDTYKTLKGIMNAEYKHPPEVSMVDEAHPGVSLFQPIPEWRGCREAGIPAHYCLCESFTPLPSNDPRIIQGAKAIMNSLNQKLEPAGDLCVKYTQFHVNISKITTTGDALSIILKMVPYPGNFRAYVKVAGGSYTVHDIERLDNYRDLSSCLDKLAEKQVFTHDTPLASYCVCSDLKLNYFNKQGQS